MSQQTSEGNKGMWCCTKVGQCVQLGVKCVLMVSPLWSVCTELEVKKKSTTIKKKQQPQTQSKSLPKAAQSETAQPQTTAKFLLVSVIYLTLWTEHAILF